MGAGGCLASVDWNEYFGDGGFAAGTGEGTAHVATASAGLAFMEKGFRMSLEYMFAYAFYVQTVHDDMARTQDPNMRAAWESRLTSDRHGLRIQVGYAF